MYIQVVFLFLLLSVDAAPNVYDQSQNGELNIQVDLKDLQIFALMKGQHEEYYEDIDYAYDYSEMTIKPHMSTSKRPLNVTTTGSSTDNVTEMTFTPVMSTAQNPLNATIAGSSLDNVTETTAKPAISTPHNSLYVTTTGATPDNVTEITIKPQVSSLENIMNISEYQVNNSCTGPSTEEITVATTVSTLETSKNNTEEHDGFLGFFSRFFVPFSSTISNTPSRLLDQHSREDDGITITSQNKMEATEHFEAATKNTNATDPVTRKPQSLMSNISPIKSEIEYTTKIVDNIGSNVTANSNCKKGFVLNQRGECELKIQAMSSHANKLPEERA